MAWDMETYQTIARKQGEKIRVFDDQLEEGRGGYLDISTQEFYQDRDQGGGRFLLPEHTNYALIDDAGNLVRTRKRGEAYSYLDKGYSLLDEQIVDAIDTETKDLETGRFDQFLGEGAFSTFLGSATREFERWGTFGFSELLRGKTGGAERYQKIQEQVRKERHPKSSGAGTTIGTIAGGIGIGGVSAKATAKTFQTLTKAGVGSKKAGVIASLAGSSVFTAPYSISKGLAEKDLQKGLEDFLVGTTLMSATGGVLKLAGKGLKGGFELAGGKFKTLSEATNRAFYSFKKAGDLQKFTEKQRPLLESMLDDADDPLTQILRNEILSSASKERLKKVFQTNDLSKVNKWKFHQKRKEVLKSLSDDEVLMLNTKILNKTVAKGELSGSGSAYTQTIKLLQDNTEKVSGTLKTAINKASETQQLSINSNAKLKGALSKIPFVESILGVSSAVAKQVREDVRKVSTAHIKEAIKKLSKKATGDLNRKEFTELSMKLIYWAERNRSKLTSQRRDVDKFLTDKGDDFIAYMKKEGFDDDEIITIQALYDNAINGNPKLASTAREIFSVEALVAKKGRLTIREAQYIKTISDKYARVQNPFAKKSFSPLRNLSEVISKEMLPKGMGLVTKEEITHLISKSFRSGFNEVGFKLSQSQITKEMSHVLGVVNSLFKDKNAISVKELSNIIQGLRQNKQLFSGDVLPKSFYEKMVVDISKFQNNKVGEFAQLILKDKNLRGKLSAKELLALKNINKTKKNISFNLNNIEQLQRASGADLSAFLIKDSLIGIGGAFLGFGLGGIPTAVLAGGAGVALSYFATQAIKGGWGLRGMTDLAKRTSNMANNAVLRFNKMSNPSFLSSEIRKGGTASIFKSGVGIAFISNAVFGEEVDSVQELRPLVYQAVKDPAFLNGVKNNMSHLQDGYMQDGGFATPERQALKQGYNYKMLQVILHNLNALGGNVDDFKLEQFEQDMAVVFDPTSVIDRMRDSTITMQQVNNFKQLYPRKYNDIRNNFLMDLSKGKIKVDDFTYQQQISLSMFLDYDLTGVRGGFNVDTNYKGMQRIGQEFKRKVDQAEQFETITQQVERF